MHIGEWIEIDTGFVCLTLAAMGVGGAEAVLVFLLTNCLLSVRTPEWETPFNMWECIFAILVYSTAKLYSSRDLNTKNKIE